MRMLFKKEVKHSVVYETEAPKAPCRSVYVSKDWLTANPSVNNHPSGWPAEIELEVRT